MFRIHAFTHFSSHSVAGGTALLALVASTTLTAGDLTVQFADGSGWDGNRVPEGQHCDRFDGSGSTPPLEITGLPEGTDAVIVEYSDRDSRQMNNGGHGKLGLRVDAGTTQVSFPAVPGHTFDLPDGVFLVKAHRNPDWATAGAYMPPCSGGQGNTYYLTVIAARTKNFEKRKFKKLGKAKLVMGNY